MRRELSRSIYFMKVVFVSYNNQSGYSTPEAWLERVKTFAALMEALATHCEVAYIKQINYEGSISRNAVKYIFLRSAYRKPFFPGRINNSVEQLNPDVVIVSGLLSPLQIIQLRWKLGKKVQIIGRHHGDRPPTGFRRVLQRRADRCLNAYLFTSMGNASEWIDAGMIQREKKIYELIEASTELSRRDRSHSLQSTGMNGKPNFLWVGRLNANKDPLTVLKGFEKYLSTEPTAKLYMIFGEDDLLKDVGEFIEQSPALSKAVALNGFIPNDQLSTWYSAADFYITGSHSEGGSYALIEAMACGCIPIVTAIPAALKMIGDGEYGIVFQPGNADELAKKFSELSLIDTKALSSSVENYFKKELSTEAIAAKLYGYCVDLLAK